MTSYARDGALEAANDDQMKEDIQKMSKALDNSKGPLEGIPKDKKQQFTAVFRDL